MDERTGMTERSDFAGIVMSAAWAAMDRCPWVQKGREAEIAEAVAETVADRIGQVDSVLLPDGQVFAARRQQTSHVESLALEAYTQIGNCGCLPGPSHSLCPRCELLRDMLTALAAAYPDYDDVGPDDEYRGQ